MRLNIYYTQILRRDLADKELYVRPEDMCEMNSLYIFVSCKGLTKVVDINVLRSLLLFEMLTGIKGQRGVGLPTGVGSSKWVFNSFMCYAILKERHDMFDFIDSWAYKNDLHYTEEGGEVEWKERGTNISATYSNMGNLVKGVNMFYRLRGKFCYVIGMDKEDDYEVLMDGLGIR